MRLLAYTDALGRGGAEHSLGHLLAHLPADIDAHVVGPGPALTGWLAARRPGCRRHVAVGAAATARVLRALRPDVVHVSRPAPWTGRLGLAVALSLPGTRVSVVDQLPLRTVDPVVLLRTRALTRRVDAAVAVGRAGARRMEDFYALGRGSVRSIPNFVPDPGPPPPRRAPDGVLRLVSVGRLDPVKGHDVLLRALVDLPGVHATLLGEGSRRRELEGLVSRLGLAGRVDLPGWTDDVAGALPSYDALVLPSRTEGWPLTVVEAMLAALPVVATTVGSVPEALGGTGLLVDSDDADGLAAALRRLRDEPGLARRLGEQGRARAAGSMTAGHMAGQWLALWEELMASPRTPRLRPPAARP